MIAYFFIIITLFTTILVNIYKLHKNIAQLEKDRNLEREHNALRHARVYMQLSELLNERRRHEKE